MNFTCWLKVIECTHPHSQGMDLNQQVKCVEGKSSLSPKNPTLQGRLGDICIYLCVCVCIYIENE